MTQAASKCCGEKLTQPSFLAAEKMSGLLQRFSLDGQAMSFKSEILASNSTGAQPYNVVQSVYHYTPNLYGAVVAMGLYKLASVLLLLRTVQRKNWWGLCLAVGAWITGSGFILRIVLIDSQDSIILFVVSQLSIVCSPAAFLAFNYVVYGRILKHYIARQHSIIRPELVARLFIVSDVMTFLVQSGGGSLQAIQNPSVGKIGAKIFLIGLIMQAASYIIFMGLVIHTHRRISKLPGEYPRGQQLWTLFWLLYFSSVFIVIRSVYRVIELAQGFGGFLLTHEIYFYLLDTLPLFIAIAVYIPFWPGSYLPHNPGPRGTELKAEEHIMSSTHA